MSSTLIDIFKWWAIDRKDVAAIVTAKDQITYSELDQWAEAVANWLISEGLKRGERVTILATNSMEWIVLSQAVMLAGGILAPVNPRFTVSEVAYMVGERYQSKFIFHDTSRAELAAGTQAEVANCAVFNISVIDQFRRGSLVSDAARPDIGLDDEVVIIPTSGSTGHPKGVVYSHRSLSSYVSETALAEPYSIDKAKVLLFGPLCTSAGYVVTTQYLAYGGTVFVEEAFEPLRAIQMIQEHGITVMMGAPIFFERMAASDSFATADLASLRYCLVGGARVSNQLLETWLAKGVTLRQLYGQTEAGGQATVNSRAAAVNSPEKCGRGSAFTRIAIVDDKGEFCGPNTPGEIVIKGAGIMTRYWNDEAATAKTLVKGWLHTGDLGMVDEQGLLTMLDRLKDIIISGGINISAAELERVISEVQGVEEVAVIAAKDDAFGETPLAIIYGNKDLSVEAIIAHCNTHLSGFKVPRYVVLEPQALPRLATGKIAKPALRSKYANAHVELSKVR